MVILESARKHGYTDEEIYHAARYRILTHDMDGYLMVIGPTPSGELLEIGINRRDEAFHAMKARNQLLPHKR